MKNKQNKTTTKKEIVALEKKQQQQQQNHLLSTLGTILQLNLMQSQLELLGRQYLKPVYNSYVIEG